MREREDFFSDQNNQISFFSFIKEVLSWAILISRDIKQAKTVNIKARKEARGVAFVRID